MIAVPGIDQLFAKSLIEIISSDLGPKTLKKIENRLFEKFGLSLTQSIEQFDSLDLVLREFFGKGADALERKFFEKILKVKTKKSNNDWFTLSDSYANSIILKTYGDLEKRNILETVSETPKIINDIIKDCDLPRTSGYRKINSMIDDGLLCKADYIIVENKKINKYVCVFSNLKINIEKNKMSIDVQFTDLERQRSPLLQTIFQ
ncbi:MAG: hypothetical protein ACE5DU_05275 [Nitrosopumilus sp.]